MSCHFWRVGFSKFHITRYPLNARNQIGCEVHEYNLKHPGLSFRGHVEYQLCWGCGKILNWLSTYLTQLLVYPSLAPALKVGGVTKYIIMFICNLLQIIIMLFSYTLLRSDYIRMSISFVVRVNQFHICAVHFANISTSLPLSGRFIIIVIILFGKFW